MICSDCGNILEERILFTSKEIFCRLCENYDIKTYSDNVHRNIVVDRKMINDAVDKMAKQLYDDLHKDVTFEGGIGEEEMVVATFKSTCDAMNGRIVLRGTKV